MKRFIYVLQAIPLYTLLFLFRLLPLDAASSLGGLLGRILGPRLAASRKAYKNLNRVFPDWDERRKRETVRAMWDNLGRVMAEYPHLEQIGRERVNIVNQDILDETFARQQGGIFIAAHLGNWEINAPALLTQLDIPLHLTFRNPNNPFAARCLNDARTLKGRITAYPKARASGRALMNVLKNKGFIGLLIDQKYNEGVAVDFFGQPAMTTPIFVSLAQKYKCPVIAARNIRLKGAWFETKLYPPLQLFDAAGAPLPAETVIADSHRLLESWIAAYPGQWLWLHRRWSSKVLQNAEKLAEHAPDL